MVSALTGNVAKQVLTASCALTFIYVSTLCWRIRTIEFADLFRTRVRRRDIVATGE